MNDVNYMQSVCDNVGINCWIYTKIHMNCFYLESNQDRVDLKDVVACPVPLTGAK